ncbi:hypothetical protein FRB90_001222 [Tulasnella sp. 427]|nr:hypothetical protein FRB90_001222 [Tulasnella sp. 427]
MPGASSRSHTKVNAQPEAGPSQPRLPKTKDKPQKEYQACKFFPTSRGCYNGDSCRFLHDASEPPCELSKVCRFYAKGYCLHGSRCWYKHVAPSVKPNFDPVEPEQPATPEEITCGICFEVPVQFGLLNGCSHPFCLNCLRDWRKSRKKDIHLVFSNIIKTCPLCRVESRFITPSSRFYPLGDPKRDELIAAYKVSMAKITCRYFESSPHHKRFCPYGFDCFYKHEDPITGVKHEFNHGVDEMMVRYKEHIQQVAQRNQARYRYASTYSHPYSHEFDWLAVIDGMSDGPDPLDAFADLSIQESDVSLEPPQHPLGTSFSEGEPPTHWPTEEDLEYVRSFYDVFARLRPRDRDRDSLPFYQIEGLINVRSLPLPNPTSTRGLILRSGEPNGMTDTGKRQLLDLGIKRVFDLRSVREVQRLAKDDIFIIPGVEIVSVPALVIAKGDQMGNTFQRFECGTDVPFMESYGDILNEGASSFKTIFDFLRDHLSSGDGCLIHCTAGKDRTGVACMLILDLIGLSDEEIAKDYALTRIGLESGRDTLIARFQHLMDNPETRAGAENAFSSRRVLQAGPLATAFG